MDRRGGNPTQEESSGKKVDNGQTGGQPPRLEVSLKDLEEMKDLEKNLSGGKGFRRPPAIEIDSVKGNSQK